MFHHPKFQKDPLSLPSTMKLRRLCFYTCLSVHGGGVCLVHAGIPPPGSRQPPRSRHPPGADTPLEQTPPHQQTSPGETATAADGTHPTGMHSYFNGNFSHLCGEITQYLLLNFSNTLTDILEQRKL